MPVEHPLVEDRARREARHVEEAGDGLAPPGGLLLGEPPHEVEFAFERLGRDERRGRGRPGRSPGAWRARTRRGGRPKPARRASRGARGPRPARGARSARGSGRPQRRRGGERPCRRRTRRRGAGRSRACRPRRAGNGRGAAAAAPRRRRWSCRRRPRRGARGSRARAPRARQSRAAGRRRAARRSRRRSCRAASVRRSGCVRPDPLAGRSSFPPLPKPRFPTTSRTQALVYPFSGDLPRSRRSGVGRDQIPLALNRAQAYTEDVMKFATKLMLALSGTVLLGAAAAIAIVGSRAERLLERQIVGRLQDNASRTIEELDEYLYERVTTPGRSRRTRHCSPGPPRPSGPLASCGSSWPGSGGTSPRAFYTTEWQVVADTAGPRDGGPAALEGCRADLETGIDVALCAGRDSPGEESPTLRVAFVAREDGAARGVVILRLPMQGAGGPSARRLRV